MISASEIRRSFLDFFAEHEHQKVPSSPLVPKDDPSLLFTNAGMVQFKKVFLGQEKRGYNRATTSQKCLRVGGKHNDLENVGRTARHHTFFEMLGNFSFGDYFKEEAIKLAWDYLTKELELPADRLYASVFKDDDEAFELWKKIAGLPDSRIYRLDEKDNFWAMGDTGPCGPCSEILIDQGEHMACGPNCEIGVCECDRYLEIWNLVFMQYDRDESGEMAPLPKPSIDTGMGLERIAAVCQGVYSNFDTDLFSGLIQSTSYKAGVRYGEDPDKDTALRVIADHSRAASFMIADGILPANEGRGYVLRRLIRRAFRFGRFLGLEGPFLNEVCGQMVGEMGEAYPELIKSNEFIAKVVCQEEENFGKTLDKGLSLLDEDLKTLKQENKASVPGEIIFKLYDTFGFPVDIVRDLAEKQGFEIDEKGFDKLMQEQRKRSKETWTGSGEVDLASEFADYLEAGWQTEFVGYEIMQASSRIVALMDTQGNELKQAEEGIQVYLVTARTPFYGESGGQVGDTGRILAETGMAKVLNTLKPAPNFIVHKAEMVQGNIQSEQEVNLHVNEEQRKAVARNHTCTHLLHAALRKVLGEHVKQSGSLVSKDRLRFDFTHIHPLTAEEIKQVEDLVNQAIFDDIRLSCRVVSFEQAMQEGALGLFAEKYQDQVRVVEIPGVTKELCGGTHLQSTGEAGMFAILSETGIASGIRRIEAATAWNLLESYREQQGIVRELASQLRSRPEQILHKVSELQEQIKTLNKEKEELEARQSSAGGGESLLGQAEDVNGYKILASRLDIPESSGMKGLRNIMDNLRTQVNSGSILLASEGQGKAMLLLYVSKNLHDRFTAPEIVQEVAGLVGGSGGGRPDLAQAGGSNPEGIDQALDMFKEIVRQKIA